jgi:uroporphyrinogen decarboxylase
LDAAIIFSDILVIPQALGMVVDMEPGVGPVLPEPLKVPEDANNLDYAVDVTKAMKGTLNAITLTRHLLKGKVPLLGFSGAPWTLLSYMIEGGGSRTLSKSKAWLYKYPNESIKIMTSMGKVVTRYLVEQVAAGAQMVQIFESHADLLGPDLFRSFCLPILEQILEDFRDSCKERKLDAVPVVIFAKGAHYALRELGRTSFNVIGVDWTVDPYYARHLIGTEKVLQGNLDPCALYSPKTTLENAVREMIHNGFTTTKYICNLGHGIYPDTPPESVEYFINAVHGYVE